jgi:hypothetical protein
VGKSVSRRPWRHLSAADYRQLAGTLDLAAIVTVDWQAGQILGVKFPRRQSGKV